MLEIKQTNGKVSAQVTTERKGRNSSVYVYYTDGLLIDSGPSSLLPDLISFFNSVDFDQVVLTHHHEDHTGGAKWIQDHKRVPLFINSISVDICSKDGEYPEYRHQTWGSRKAFIAEPLTQTFQSRSEKWESIFTPGHAFDHMVFLNHSTGTLFSGDLFVTPKPKCILVEEHIPTTINSLKKILTYNFSEVYCSNKGYLPNGKDLLVMKLDFLEYLRGEILELHHKGYTVDEIQAKLLPNQYPLVEISNHEWDSRHIVTSVLDAKLSSI